MKITIEKVMEARKAFIESGYTPTTLIMHPDHHGDIQFCTTLFGMDVYCDPRNKKEEIYLIDKNQIRYIRTKPKKYHWIIRRLRAIWYAIKYGGE